MGTCTDLPMVSFFSDIPKLPHYSHVQSHAAIFKNNLCDSPAVRRGDRRLYGPRQTRSVPLTKTFGILKPIATHALISFAKKENA
jgi:hypothetical protein